MLRWLKPKKPLTLGQRGERLAARFLRRQGYRILGRNVKLGDYEIDIITHKEDTIAFVEVKTRSDDFYADPEENVDHTKREHIRKAARRYIETHDYPDMYYRFDVVSILAPPNARPQVTVYYNAFDGG